MKPFEKHPTDGVPAIIRKDLPYMSPLSILAAFVVLTCFMGIARPQRCFSLTLEEAVSLAKENLPSLKGSKLKLDSTEALYDASLAPYLPSLDASTAQEKHDINSREFDLSTYDVTLSYVLFDGGKRKANRNIAKLNRDIDKEGLDTGYLDLRFNVQTAFFTSMARKEILEERKIQLQDAGKDYEVAHGRHALGAAKLSDVLQASVRLEQAKFNRVQAEGDWKKSVAELNSLLGKPLEAACDLQGSLDFQLNMPDVDRLSKAVLQRPEIKQAQNSVDVSKSNKALETAAFFPVITAKVSYSKSEGSFFGGLSSSGSSSSSLSSAGEDRSVGLQATWNIFELGKYYRRKSSDFQIHVSREKLNETVRQLLLDLRKAHEDYLTTSQNVAVALEQLKQAEYNYARAFGEYKVGKADILSLVQAESLLAGAREQRTTSRLNLILAKALLERATGLEKLDELSTEP